MIRFKIVGRGYLELPSNFEFSFKYNNCLFAFENMQLSRSGEFKINRTPANDALLEFSHDFVFNGNFVRQKKLAELHYSGGKIDGYIYFGKYESGAYSAIFVYGELSALKAISDLGNITEYVQSASYVITDEIYIDSAYFSDGIFTQNFRFYDYKNGIADADKLVTGMNLSPSARLSLLLSLSATAAGITVDTTEIGPAKDGIVVVLAGNKASETLEDVTVSGTPNSSFSVSGGSQFFTVSTKTFKYKTFNSLLYKSQNVVVFTVKRDCKIRFENLYIQYGIVTGTGSTFLSTGYTDGWFRPILEDSEIELKTGDYFTFVNQLDYYFDTPIENFNSSISVAFKVYSGDAGTVDLGDDYYLKPNLPEITFIDILKIYANLFKCGILYDAATNTVSFFNFDFDKSTAMSLDDLVIEIKSVNRTFLDYAQNNRVVCKSEDYVIDNKFGFNYQIDNDNLQAEKIIYTIPFSEGILDVNSDVLINDFELVDQFKKTAKIGTLAVASKTVGQTHLKHISQLYQNFTITDNLTGIIRNSTTVEMSVKMDAKTFIAIKNTDTFKYRGIYFCLIEATHSSGVANLVLIKI